MNETAEFSLRAVLTGAGATVVMDLWAVVLRQFRVPSLNIAFLGRWIGHLPRGHWRHPSIASATPVRGESSIGWCAHYAIGTTFSALLLWTYGLEWARSPTLLPALFMGSPLLRRSSSCMAGRSPHTAAAAAVVPSSASSCRSLVSLLPFRRRARAGLRPRAGYSSLTTIRTRPTCWVACWRRPAIKS